MAGDYYYYPGSVDKAPHNGSMSENNTTNINGSSPDLPPHGNPYEYYYYLDKAYTDMHTIIYYKGFDFERPVYLYVWNILVLFTTLVNILVVLVLVRRSLRNATNVILIAVAIADSMTGLVTMPVMIYAYTRYENGDLALTENWCEAFMLVRYFISRSFHTMSIWLTVLLGIQRLVSVSFPFRAQTLFSIPKTAFAVCIISLLSPFLHIYHAFKKKTIPISGICEWQAETPCRESCAYLWLIAMLMHFLPCLFLISSTAAMVFLMRQSTRKMRESNMIANQKNLSRRDVESRRITCVVIAVVVVFMIPEVPYGVFFLITASLRQSGQELLPLKTNRTLICVYEILVALSFQANFWIYLVMNRRFRRGLHRTVDPLIHLFNNCLDVIGIERTLPRLRTDSVNYIGRSERRSSENFSNTVHSRLTPLNSIVSRNVPSQEPVSPTESISSPEKPFEMKTYHFQINNGDGGIGKEL